MCPLRPISRATHLVTYDPHFDVLGGVYQGIPILDGLHFLYVVRGDRPPTQESKSVTHWGQGGV